LDVKGLKLPDGAPHDLGQFYFLVDPTTFAGDTFYDRLARLSDAVAEQPNARLPGSNRVLPEDVSISADLWEKTLNLAH
jgi:(2R)-3-sulfolactate dehydrogenase (NADP+)